MEAVWRVVDVESFPRARKAMLQARFQGNTVPNRIRVLIHSISATPSLGRWAALLNPVEDPRRAMAKDSGQDTAMQRHRTIGCIQMLQQ